MNKLNKILGIFLVVALIATIFIGAGAAVTSTSSSLSTSENTVYAGQSVTATVTFKVDASKLAAGDVIKVETNFATPWKAYITVEGGDVKISDEVDNDRPTYDCIHFTNAADVVTVKVTCEGSIPSNKEGQTITPLKVSVVPSASGSTSESGSVSTKSVYVYDSSSISTDIITANSVLSALNSRIALYSTTLDLESLGVSLSVPQNYIESASSYLTRAQESGISEYSASQFVVKAQNELSKAESSLNELALEIVRKQLAKTDELITNLKGMNRNVENISTQYMVLENKYNGYSKTTDSAKIDELIQDVQTLYEKAYNDVYYNPMDDFMKILPYIIIGVVAVIVGIIVFLIIRRRRNSWDELG